MDLVLTEARGGGHRAHRPTCKKIATAEQFDPEELTPEALQAATACSSCKPKDVDMEAMLATVFQDADEALEASVSEQPEEPVDPPVVEPTELLGGGESESAGVDDDWDDDEDLLGGDEDLLGVETTEDGTEAEPEVAERKAPKAVPASKPAKAAELKTEEADALVQKVAEHLGLNLGEYTFPGFGKAIKTVDRQTLYLNSKGTADVRANSPEQAAGWVEEGLAERRGGNYVRVNVRGL